MRKLIMWNVISLDGYFEGEKPWDLGFHELVWGPELEALSQEQLDEADMLVFGKRTYEGMFDYWSKAEETSEDKIAKKMNSIPKIVCSKTLKNVHWNNTKIITDAVVEIAKLKLEGDKPMYLFGSGQLAHSLFKANLFDELRLCIAPIILGKGNRLFPEIDIHQRLQLNQSHQFEKGGMLLKYKVANF